MANSPTAFRAAVLTGWVVLSGAALAYGRAAGIPDRMTLPVLAAFLIEFPFYLVPAFPTVRARWKGPLFSAWLAGSAALPYLACCFGAVPFDWMALLRLAALGLALGLWFRLLPHASIVDVLFLVLVAGVMLGGYFDAIYPTPTGGFPDRPARQIHDGLITLAKLALIRIAVMSLIVERGMHDFGYGFLPARADWRIGVLHYFYFVPIGFPLALLLGATRLRPEPAPIWADAAVFLGILWVVALSEEYFFRGVLQQWIEEWTWNRTAALVLTSILFGASHLSFRFFPNWKWTLVAAVLGFFCGRARNAAGNIRAGMVTHALVVTTWRAFFA